MSRRTGAKRSLAQHFLNSPAVKRRVLDCCAARSGRADAILEIGPGKGALTEGLLDLGLPVTAVELDDALAVSLVSRFPDLTIKVADARRLDIDAMAAETGVESWLVAGNLPYNVGTNIVKRALAFPGSVSAMIVMLQKEVAEKFCSSMGETGYGALSVWRAAWWRGDILFSVLPGSFSPPPTVVSAVCAFEPVVDSMVALESMESYRKFLSRAFARPRRTLAKSLGEDTASRYAVKSELERLGLNPLSRPGEVSAPHFVELMERLSMFC